MRMKEGRVGPLGPARQLGSWPKQLAACAGLLVLPLPHAALPLYTSYNTLCRPL